MTRLFFFFIFITTFSFGQKQTKQSATAAIPFDTTITNQLEFRNIGPWRGGRSSAVVGDPDDKQVFYFGSTGGGVWKTIDGGGNWKNISDGYFGGSIGSIAVSKSDPTILYAGGGENTLRGNVSSGTGMWKSENSGRTWKNIGLTDSRHIMRIVIHPKNPDLVYCAALGHLFGPNNERGIFRTKDGGKTWEKILFVNDHVGACELVMDPTNPDILLATFWNVKRTPYSLESGGAGSGIYKSTDGGNTWIDITKNQGLPKDTLGIIGITIAPSNPNKYYAIIESKTGGVFMSDDAGKTWTKTNSDNNLRQRAWYFSKIFCDPKNEDLLYILNVEFWKSNDGGKIFSSVNTLHGDHHNLWIDPEDGNRMIVADDGGAQISFDGSKTWSTYYNQPTGQFYRVSTDNDVPYRLLGAQQDNSSVRIFHQSTDGQIDGNDWEPTAGFESGYIVADPLNPDIVYGGNYSGFIGCYNHVTGDSKVITVWPDDPIGQGGENLKYRFQWNFPLFFSPHDPKKLYAAGNVLFYTIDGGLTWNPISPDLTTNDKSKQKKSGGMITKDNTGVEIYCTIFTAAESPIEKDLIYTGSDDGLLHVTKNGGQTWENITPSDLPPNAMFNCVEPDPFQKGKLYFAATRYKLDDYKPYLFVTENYGATWKKITNGIPSDHFTRVIRADKKRPGLLYCGTEYGFYISYDDGANWFPFQNNLPMVPVTDMTIKDNDLVIATQGRGFWIIDDLSVLQAADQQITKNNLYVFPIRDVYNINGAQNDSPVNAGKNPAPGVVINYYLKTEPDSAKKISIELYDDQQKLIKTFSPEGKKEMELKAIKGLNQFNWGFDYSPAETIEGMNLWNGTPGSPKAPPGNYTAKIKFGNDSVNMHFNILPDPNLAATTADYKAQFDLLMKIQNKFNETQKAIKDIRSIKSQVNDYISKLGTKAPQSLKDSVASVSKQLSNIEEALNETRNTSTQDMLNYGIKLNDKLAGLYNVVSTGNSRPSKQSFEVYDYLAGEVDKQLEILKVIKSDKIQQLNDMIRDENLPAIIAD